MVTITNPWTRPAAVTVLPHQQVWNDLGAALTSLRLNLLHQRRTVAADAVSQALGIYDSLGMEGAGSRAWHSMSRGLVAEMAAGHSPEFRTGLVAALELHKAAYINYCTPFNS